MCRSEYDRVKDNINVKTITFLLPGVLTDTSVFTNFKGASVSFLFARKKQTTEQLLVRFQGLASRGL